MGSSVDKFLEQTGGRNATPAQASDTTSDVDRFLGVDPEVQARLGIGATTSATTTPDSAARILRLQSKTGLPEDLIARNLDAIEKDARAADFDPKRYSQSSPIVGRWLAEHPQHMALASQDLTRLHWWERQWGNMKAQYTEGNRVVELSKIGEAAMRGTVTPAMRKRQADLEAQATDPQRDYGLTGFFEGIPGALANQVPIWKNTVFAQAKAAAYGGLAAGEIGMIGGAGIGAASGAGVGGVGAIPGAAAGATTGFVVAGRGGAMAGWKWGGIVEAGRLEGTLAYLDMEKIKDKNGNPLDPKTMRGAAMIVGAVNGALEMVGMETIQKAVPGWRSLSREGIKQMFMKPTMRAALLKAAKHIGESTVTEGGTEFLQSLVSSAGGELATMINDGSIRTMTGEEIIARIFSPDHVQQAIAEGRAGAQAGFGGAAAGQSVDLVKNYQDIKKAEQRQQFFTALGADAQNSEMLKNMPSKTQEVIERLTKNGPVENMYMPLQQWKEYWQKQDIDPAKAAEEVNGDLTSYEEAEQTGGDITIRTARWAVTIAASEHNAFLSKWLRLAPDEMNYEEAQQLRGELDAMDQQQTEEAKPGAEGAEAVHEQIAEQLRSLNRYTEPQIQKMASLYSEMTRVVGERTGQTPQAILDRYNIKIEGLDTPQDEGGLQQKQEPTEAQTTLKDFLPFLNHVIGLRNQAQDHLNTFPTLLEPNEDGTDVQPSEELRENFRRADADAAALRQVRQLISANNRSGLIQYLDAIEKGVLQTSPDLLQRMKESVPSLFGRRVPLLSGFQSKLERLITEKVPKSTTVAQAKAAISGAKVEERAWTGIDAFLDTFSPDQTITRETLLQFAQSHRVHLELETLGQTAENFIPTVDDDMQSLQENILNSLIDTHARVVMSQHVGMSYEEAVKQVKDGPSFDELIDQSMDQAYDQRLRDLANDPNPGPRPLYRDYALPGGDNYREVGVRMPELTYEDPHFERQGLLAHIRLTDRYNLNGQSILFVEEIQSDLHQAARKREQLLKHPPAPDVLARAKQLRESTRQGLTAEEDREYQRMVETGVMDYIVATEPGHVMSMESIPEAPHRKTYPELALKALVVEAIKNGQMMIAWTTGRDQIARYGRGLNQKQRDGLAAFYDTMFPTIAAKFAKSFKGEVTTTKIDLIDELNYERAVPQLQTMTTPRELNAEEQQKLDYLLAKRAEWDAANNTLNREYGQLTEELGRLTSGSQPDERRIDDIIQEMKKLDAQRNDFDHLYTPEDAHDIYTLQNQKLEEQAYPNINWENHKGVPSIVIEVHAMPITDAMRRAVKHEELELYQRAFHGTPHDVDKFSLTKIGTGEGNQTYGWGLYFTGSRQIAQHYKDVLTQRRGPQLEGLTDEENAAISPEARQRMQGLSISDMFEVLTRRWEYTSEESVRLANAQEELRLKNNFFNGHDQLQRMEAETEAIERFFEYMGWEESDEGIAWDPEVKPWKETKKGRLITAEIPERTNMLLWDASLKDQLPLLNIATKLGFAGSSTDDALEYLSTGQELYENMIEEVQMMSTRELTSGWIPAKILEAVFPTTPEGQDRMQYIEQHIEQRAPEIVSRMLNAEGIKGIAYLNGQQRGKVSPHTAAASHFNYVVFDDHAVDILSQEQREGREPHRELRLKATHELRKFIKDFSGGAAEDNMIAATLDEIASAVSMDKDAQKVVGLFLSADDVVQKLLMHGTGAKNLREWLSTHGVNLHEWKAEQDDSTDARRRKLHEADLRDRASEEFQKYIDNWLTSNPMSDDELDEDPEIAFLNELHAKLNAGDAEAIHDMVDELDGPMQEEIIALPELEKWMTLMRVNSSDEMQSHSADPGGEARYEKIRDHVLYQLHELLKTLKGADYSALDEVITSLEEGDDPEQVEDASGALSDEVRDQVTKLEGWTALLDNDQTQYFGIHLAAELKGLEGLNANEKEGLKHLIDAIENVDPGFFEEVQHEYFRDETVARVEKLPSFKDWLDAAQEEENQNDDDEEDDNNQDEGYRDSSDDDDQGDFPGQSDPDAWMKQKPAEGTPKGRIKIGEHEIRIELFKAADMSTFLHETGHFFLEVLDDLGGEHAELGADRAIIRQWLGLSEDEPLTVEAHETFARAFEAYLMKGQSPNSQLRTAFARFRAWLVGIYKSVRALNVDVSPAVERVFDRMLATDTEIMAAESEVHAVPLFTDPAAVGMSPDAAAGYAAAIEEAHESASSELTAKMLHEIAREQTAQYKLRRAEIRTQVVEEVNTDPAWRARALLTRGTLPDGSELPINFEAFKLSKTSLVAYYGKEILAKLPRPHAYSIEGGLHPDVAADILGFKSGDELVNALTATRESPKKYIERLTDQRTQEVLNQEAPPEATATAAMKAVHNDKRAQLLQKELQHLASTNLAALKGLVRRVARPLPPFAEVRKQAEDQVNSKLIRDIRPIVYQRAEATAGRLAVEALLKGDINTAFEQKQRQLLNAELYRAATNAQEKVQSVVEYMSKFSRWSIRDKLAKAGGTYLAQIEAIRSRFDFTKGVSLKDLSDRESLRDFVADQHALGFTVQIPEKVLNEAYQTHYKDVSLEELTGIHESVIQIEHLARVKNKLLATGRKRNLDEAVSSIVSSIGATHNIKPEPIVFNPSFSKRMGGRVKGIIAAHTKMEFLFEWLDGNTEQGATWRQLFKPMIEAENNENVMMRNSVKAVRDIFNAYTKQERATWFWNKIHVEGIDSPLTKANVLAVALNQGNAYNKDALMRGYGWSEEQVNKILDKMDARDWQVVQKLWDHLDSYWPQIAQLEKDLNGLAPQKVEATEVKTPYGTLKGGYYPIVFDSKLSWRQAVIESRNSVPELFGGQWARAMTRHGHTEERTNTGGKPLLLELSGMSEHLGNVIHDLSHRRAVIDVNRITQRPEFRTAVEGSVGRDMYKQLHPWLLNVAGSRRAGYVNPIEGILGNVRSGATVVAMGWKMTTALAQVFSYTNSIKEIGAQYGLSGLAQVYAKPWEFKKTWSFVTERSEFMKDRIENYDRDVRDSLKSLNVAGGTPGPLSVVGAYTDPIRGSFFTLIGWMDMGASLPTWMGAYSKVMDGKVDGLESGNEQAAIDYADKVVRQTQGVGAPKDLANVQTGSEIYKNFTMFYSYFNVLFNQFAKTKHEYKLTKNVPQLIASLALLWFLPAVMQELIVGRGPDADDEPDEWLKWIAEKEIAYPFQTVVLIRDIVNGMGKFGYEPSAAFDLFKSIADVGKAGIDVVVNAKEVTRADARAAANLLGYTVKLPTRQMWLTAEYFYDWMHGNTEPSGPLDAAWRTLITGRPRETQ